MIFPKIINESIIQIGDKTRIDVSKSFVTPGSSAITMLEVSPDEATAAIDVFSVGYLDWCYSGASASVITLLVTCDSSSSSIATITSPITIIDAATDNLFSTDNDLIGYEGEILNYVREGRNSFLDKHRVMQSKILDELASAGIFKADGTRYAAADIVSHEDFKKWSMFGVLENIYEELSNQVDDIFSRKKAHYGSLKIDAKKRSTIALDLNADGTVESNEAINNFTGDLVRR
jgi:hypothetical protein